jgi:hypothetical protein
VYGSARTYKTVNSRLIDREDAVVTSGRRAKERMKDNGKVVVVEGVAPKSGTELTRERLWENLRSLNSNWTRKSKENHSGPQ